MDFTGGRWHIFMLTVIVPALASTPVVAGGWLWLAWANRRGYAWARFAFMALFGVLTIGWLFVLGASSGEDAAPYTSRDLLATTALWLVGLVAMTLISARRPARTTSAGQQREQQYRRTERKVVGRLDSTCLLVPKDWPYSDSAGHG